MNAIQFIKDHGVDRAREGIEEANAYGGFWVNAKTLELSNQIPSYDAVSIPDIQRLVESVDLIKFYGGIERAKLLLAMGTCLADRPPHAREVQLKQAIADYEAIYSSEANDKSPLMQHLDKCEKVVKTWPKWKKESIRDAFGLPNLETLRDCDTSPNCKKFDEQVK